MNLIISIKNNPHQHLITMGYGHKDVYREKNYFATQRPIVPSGQRSGLKVGFWTDYFSPSVSQSRSRSPRDRSLGQSG